MKRLVLIALALIVSPSVLAADWRIDRSMDPFTDTQNIVVLALGQGGAGLGVVCYERHLKVYFRADNPFGGSGLSGWSLPDQGASYRMRIDHGKVEHGQIEADQISNLAGHAFVDMGQGHAGSLVKSLMHAKRLVYQYSTVDNVYELSLKGAGHFLPGVVKTCHAELNAYQAHQAAVAAAKRKAAAAAQRKAEREQRQQDIADCRQSKRSGSTDQTRSAQGGGGQSSQSQQAALAQYARALQDRVQQNWLRPPGVIHRVKCEVRVQQSPDGDVLSVKLDNSCGSPVLNRSVMNAVKRASPLPLPSDCSVFQRTVIFDFDSAEG